MSYRSAQRLIEEDRLKWLRYPLASLFRLGAFVKNFCYDKGIITSVKSSAFVVSIGNIVAGGTGKTPILAMIANDLQKACEIRHSQKKSNKEKSAKEDFDNKKSGHPSLEPFTRDSVARKITVLTRGYGRERKGELDLSKGTYKPKECGDEPYLLSKKISNSRVLVTKDRQNAAKKIHDGIIFLDDGMQYRKLKRDLEIVIINGNCPFGKGHFLPRGYLRDPISRLKSADYIFLNHYKDNGTLEKIKEYTDAPVIGTRYGLTIPKNQKKIGVFCGIGSPVSFVNSLEEMGLEIVDTFFVKDHSLPREKELVAFSERCKNRGATSLVCTEKDFIKFEKQLVSRLPVLYADVKIIILTGDNFYQNLIRRLKEYETVD